MNDFDDFDTQIQSDELIPAHYDEDGDDDRGLTADERDEHLLHAVWREQCLDDFEDGDEDELCAVFGADDEDNFLCADHGYTDGDFDDGGEDDDW